MKKIKSGHNFSPKIFPRQPLPLFEFLVRSSCFTHWLSETLLYLFIMVVVRSIGLIIHIIFLSFRKMHPVVTCSEENLAVSTLEGSCLIYSLTAANGGTSLDIKSVPGDKKVDTEAIGTVLCIRFSNNGKLLAICNDYKQIQLYTAGKC